MKRLAARGLDIASWFLAKGSGVHYHHWESVLGDNKGDIAIREAIKSQLRAAFKSCHVQFQELQWGQLNEDMADRLNQSCDLFVIAGSGYVRFAKDGELPSAMVQDLKAFKKIKCPKIAYGIGWNSPLDKIEGDKPTHSARAMEQLAQSMQAIDLVSVRDRATQTLLSSLGDCDPILLGDPAIFYADLFPPRNPRPPAPDRKLQIGLNMALHTSAVVDLLARQFDNYCSFLRALSDEYKVTFHYVPHVQTGGVIPLMLASRGIFVRSHDLPPDELIYFYRTLDLHICQLMHSSILAVSALVPTINFGYDIKNRGFFELMGLDEFYFSALDFDQEAALAAARKLIAERNTVSQRIADRKMELRQEFDSFLHSVVSATVPDA